MWTLQRSPLYFCCDLPLNRALSAVTSSLRHPRRHRTSCMHVERVIIVCSGRIWAGGCGGNSGKGAPGGGSSAA
eukprot:2864027-Pyramimonas_sp.AAC.1